MKILKNFLRQWGGGIAALALAVGVAAADSACIIWFHQPKVPQGLDKFKKQK